MRTGWAVVSALGAWACGQPGVGGRAVQPDPPPAASTVVDGDEHRCPDASGRGRPLIVDWGAADRTDLEVALGRGIGVVKYACNRLELLPDCRTEGGYDFIAVSIKEDSFQLVSSDEVRVNLPGFGTEVLGKLGVDIQRGSSLDLATILVGKSSTTATGVTSDRLQGTCQGATHYVRGTYVGAFAMTTGRRGQLSSVAKVFGVGVEGRSDAREAVRQLDGDLEACRRSRPDADAPPDRCRASVRLELMPIGATVKEPALPPELGECPAGYVRNGAKCSAPSATESFVCDPEAPSQCEAQCQRGNAESCYNLAITLAAGRGVGRDAERAQELYRRACDAGVPKACFVVAAGLAGAEDPALARQAVPLCERACDAGVVKGCRGLAWLFQDGLGVSQDAERAGELLLRACHAGDPGSCLDVAEAYEQGRGLPQDQELARRYRQRAGWGGVTSGP